jgi:hypothetical protein
LDEVAGGPGETTTGRRGKAEVNRERTGKGRGGHSQAFLFSSFFLSFFLSFFFIFIFFSLFILHFSFDLILKAARPCSFARDLQNCLSLFNTNPLFRRNEMMSAKM